MKERNKNNSIIFLTTLSVYLGLVLVGGAMSPVLAQSTKKQECDSAELENKSQDAFSKIGINYGVADLAQELEFFVFNGNNFYKEGVKFFHYDFVIEVTYDNKTKIATTSVLPTSKGLGHKITPTSELGESIFPLVENLALSFKNALHKENFDASYEISFDNEEFLSIFKFQLNDDSQSKKFVDAYGLKNQSMICTWDGDVKDIDAILQENTKATFENNQILITTRLPRGSLEELYKKRESGK